MEKLHTIKRLRAFISIVISVALVVPQMALAQVSVAPGPQVFKAFSAMPSDLEQAKATTDAAETRFLSDFREPTAHVEFAMLIRANEIIGVVEKPTAEEYARYVLANFAKLSNDNRVAGIPNISWQMFLTQTYILFQIERTNALNQPNDFMIWLKKAYENPHVALAVYGTWRLIVGSIQFVQGVAYGAMVAGPGAGAVNAGLNPIMTPLNQKLTVIGLKYFGPAGMWLNWLFFERKLEKQAAATAEDLSKASENIENLRRMITGSHYEINNQQWAENRSTRMQIWNRLQFLFGLTADAYRGGRHLEADLVLLRQRDFAQAAANAISAAEIQRQSAEQIIDRMIARGVHSPSLEAGAKVLMEMAGEQVSLEREAPERAAGITGEIERAKQDLLKAGLAADSVERMHENYRNYHAFRRQAATMLAAQTMNDAMYSDTIEGARTLYEAMYRNTALNHMHDMLKFEVVEVLKKMKFLISVKANELDLQRAARKNISAEQRLQEIKAGDNSVRRVFTEPGSLAAPEAKTGEQRAREAARGALRK